MKVTSNVFAQATGSMAGLTFARSGGGIVVGKRSHRTNGQSRIRGVVSDQYARAVDVNKGAIAASAGAWRSLLEDERGSYLQADENGASGYSLFARRYYWSRVVTFVPINGYVPPVSLNGAGDLGLTIARSSVNPVLIVNLSGGIPAGMYTVVFSATRLVSPGVTYLADRDYKRLSVFWNVSGGTRNITNEFIDWYGSFSAPAGTKLGLRAQLVHQPSHTVVKDQRIIVFTT